MTGTDPNALAKESGAMWSKARNRDNGENPVLFYESGDQLVEFAMRDGEWTWSVRDITLQERSELWALYGSDGLPLLVGSRLRPTQFVIRGFVRNGRKTDWNLSVRKAEQNDPPLPVAF